MFKADSIFCAPNILILFINMVLLSRTTSTDNMSSCDPYMYPYQVTSNLYNFTFCLVPLLTFL